VTEIRRRTTAGSLTYLADHLEGALDQTPEQLRTAALQVLFALRTLVDSGQASNDALNPPEHPCECDPLSLGDDRSADCEICGGTGWVSSTTRPAGRQEGPPDA
jgi:hypothetical protein